MKRPHLIAGEMKFEDGFVTRREMVVGGELDRYRRPSS